MSTSLRQLWVICIPLLFIGCAQDHYINGAGQFRVGTQNGDGNSPTPTPTPGVSYVYATQDNAFAVTSTASGNWMPFANVRADLLQEFENGIFQPKSPGIYAVHFRVGFAAPGTWSSTDWVQAYVAKSDGTIVASNTVGASQGSPSALVAQVSVDVALTRGQAIRFGVIATRNMSTFQQPNNGINNVSITSLFKAP